MAPRPPREPATTNIAYFAKKISYKAKNGSQPIFSVLVSFFRNGRSHVWDCLVFTANTNHKDLRTYRTITERTVCTCSCYLCFFIPCFAKKEPTKTKQKTNRPEATGAFVPEK